MIREVSLNKKHVVIYILSVLVFLAIFNFYELFGYFLFLNQLPFVLVFIAGVVTWFFLSALSKKVAEESKEPVISDRYRIYLTIILTIIALLSILPLSNKTVGTGDFGRTHIPPLPDRTQNIVPPIIVVSVVSIFVATTTYIKKFYPYSAIFASAVLGIVYAASLEYVFPYFKYSYLWYSAFTVPFIVIVASTWQQKKLGVIYPIALSIVLGIVAGVAIPRTYENLELFGTFYPAVVFMFLSGITTFILYIAKFKYKLTNYYFISALKVTSSLCIYLITLILSSKFIFWHFYLGL